MKTTGLIARLQNKWINNQVNYIGETNRRIEIPQVNFNHISGVISFLCGMILFSAGILGIETLVKKYLLAFNKTTTK